MVSGHVSAHRNFILVIVLMLAVSLFVILRPASAQSSPVIIVTPTPTSIATQASTPTPTNNVAMDYNEVNRTSEGVDTRLVLAVNARYNFGGPVTIDFQSFTLNIAVERGGPPPIQQGDYIFTGTAKPIETGTVTLDSNNSESFQLTFEFPTMQPNAHAQTPFTNYQLAYSASPTTASPAPTPTAPEFS